MKKLLAITGFVVIAFASSFSTYAGKVSPETVSGAETIDSSKAKALFDKGVLFVDVRSDKDWSAGRIPDAVHLE